MLQIASRALGWFSAGLGAVQLVTPGVLLRAVGIAPTPGRRIITRLIGARELSAVPGLLSTSLPAGWLAARVAGDVMDLALLGAAHGARDSRASRVRGAMGIVGGVLAADAVVLAMTRAAQRARSRHGGSIVRSVTVSRPVEDVYRFWSNLENLPRVMPHLESVKGSTATTSHWVARGPLGATVEWDAETITDVPNERIAWRSVPGADVHHAGEVRFVDAPGGRGTEIHVELTYRPPGGPLGRAVAAMSGEEPGQQIADALRRFKQVMETGEPILSDATATGHRLAQHPGRPLAPEESVAIPVAASVGVAS
jgi:uncharacterized membrane protein